MGYFSIGKGKKDKILKLFNEGFLSFVILKYTKSESNFYIRNIEEVSTNVEEVSTNVEEVSTNVEEVSTNVEEVSTNVGEVSTNVEEVSTNVEEVSTNVEEVSTNVGEVSTNVEEVSTNVGEVSIVNEEPFWDVESILLNFNNFLEKFRRQNPGLEYFYEIELVEEEEDFIRIIILYNIECQGDLFNSEEYNQKYPIISNKMLSAEERASFFKKFIDDYKDEEKQKKIRALLGKNLDIKTVGGSIRLPNNYVYWKCSPLDIL